METTYALAAAPRHAAMSAHDCARCGHPEVRPVWLASDAGVRPYGSGCAARLLGSTVHHVRREADVVEGQAAAARGPLDLQAAAQAVLDAGGVGPGLGVFFRIRAAARRDLTLPEGWTTLDVVRHYAGGGTL